MQPETLKIYRGRVYSSDELIDQLVQMDYVQVKEPSFEGEFRRTGEVMDVFPVGFDYPIRIEWDWDQVKSIKGVDLESLFFFDSHDILIILPKFKRKRRTLDEKLPLDLSLDLKKGNVVVHINYGIGIYLGRTIQETPKGEKEFLEIEYDRGEKLFVGLDQIDLVQKYLSISKRKPKLSRLGSKEWANTKNKAKNAIKKFAFDLLKEEAYRKLLEVFNSKKILGKKISIKHLRIKKPMTN